jgi:hypothetical protein
MTDTLGNELGLLRRRPIPVEELTAAWQRALFSDAGDAGLNRYYRFHLEGIAKFSDTLPDEDGLPELQAALLFLIRHLREQYACFLDEAVPAPRAYLEQWFASNAGSRNILLDSIRRAPAVSPGLRACLCGYLEQYGNGNLHVCYTFRALQYQEKLLTGLGSLDWAHPEAEARVNALLSGLNFNHLAYFAYRQSAIKAAAAQLPYQDRPAYLQTELSAMVSTPVRLSLIYHPDWPALKDMIAAFLTEELRAVPQLPPAKLALDLSVAQLACLLRALYDEGVFATANLSEIFQFFAAHFRSKRQECISPGSLSKEFYSISQVTAAVMRDKFQKIISRINRSFFPV